MDLQFVILELGEGGLTDAERHALAEQLSVKSDELWQMKSTRDGCSPVPAYEEWSSQLDVMTRAERRICVVAVLSYHGDDSPLSSVNKDGVLYRHRLHPLADTEEQTRALAMLVLSFPDVAFIFLLKSEGAAEEAHGLGILSEPFAYHVSQFDRLSRGVRKYLEGLRAGLEPVFDATGLRSAILSGHNDRSRGEGALPVRQRMAMSIDEEGDYAYFLALACYRQGFQALPVVTKAMYEWFRHDTLGKPPFPAMRPRCVVADLYANFPDSGSPPTSNLIDRRELKFNNLMAALVLTSGSRSKLAVENDAFLAEKGWAMMHKPMPGILGLWKRFYRDNPAAQRILDKDAFWKEALFASFRIKHGTTHSSHGLFLVISEALLARSEAMLERREASPVKRVVLAAALARQALEILGGLTPAASLRALQQVHVLEVRAEAMFMGVEYQLEFSDRFKEIRSEVKAICELFAPKRIKLAMLHAELKILKDVHRELESQGERDESEAALSEIRRVERSLWFQHHPVINFPLWPVRAYVIWLMRSFSLFCLMLMLWLVVASCYLGYHLYVYTNEYPSIFDWNLVFRSAATGFLAFFGQSIDADDMKNPWVSGGLLGFGLAGFLHLGVFISYLYTLVARK